MKRYDARPCSHFLCLFCQLGTIMYQMVLNPALNELKVQYGPESTQMEDSPSACSVSPLCSVDSGISVASVSVSKQRQLVDHLWVPPVSCMHVDLGPAPELVHLGRLHCHRAHHLQNGWRTHSPVHVFVSHPPENLRRMEPNSTPCVCWNYNYGSH